MGSLFFGTFYLQLVRGYSPLQTGLLFLPFAAAQLIFAPRSAEMVRRYGPKAVCAVGMALVTAALGSFVLVTASTPVWMVGVVYFVLGAGMANVVPPVTESIMSTLPRERAGVGSAVNNTVRQVGGALGVAVLGSVLSEVYRDRIADTVAPLPPAARDTAAESISSTYAVAERLGSAGDGLLGPANDSFVTAMHYAAGGSAVVSLLAVFAVIGWLPGRSATQVQPDTASTPVAEELAETPT